MSTASRTADPTGAAHLPRRAATGAVAVGAGFARPAAACVVVIDVPRAAARFRELREALPWVDVAFDVSALAHPALLETIAAGGSGFTVSHRAALPALARSGADLGRVLYAVPGARWPERQEAWAAGVRRFVVDEVHELDAFVAAPATTEVLLRMEPDAAVHASRHAAALGVRVSGMSVPAGARTEAAATAAAAALGPEVQRAVRTSAAISAELGRHLDLLDLGDAFTGRAATRPADWADLGRTVRSLVAPATSRTTVLATAGHALVADCITVTAGLDERYADSATASAYIDAGADVVVLRESARDGLLSRLPLFRGTHTRRAPIAGAGSAYTHQARHRILRPARARSTWSPAG